MGDKHAVVDLSYIHGLSNGSGLPDGYHYLVPIAAMIEAASHEGEGRVSSARDTVWTKLVEVLFRTSSWSFCLIEGALLKREDCKGSPLSVEDLYAEEDTRSFREMLGDSDRPNKQTIVRLLEWLRGSPNFKTGMEDRSCSASKMPIIRESLRESMKRPLALEKELSGDSLTNAEKGIPDHVRNCLDSEHLALATLVILCAYPNVGHPDDAVTEALKVAERGLGGTFGTFRRNLVAVRILRGLMTTSDTGIKKRLNHVFDQEYVALAPYAGHLFSDDKALVEVVRALYPSVCCIGRQTQSGVDSGDAGI
jgi:hypothetical protein